MSERCSFPSRPRPQDLGLLRGPDALGAPHTLTGRAHGDPFPLPPLGECLRASGCSRLRGPDAGVVRRADEAIRALNALDAPTLPLRSFAPVLRPTLTQSSVFERVLRRVAAHGKPPLMDGREAPAAPSRRLMFWSAVVKFSLSIRIGMLL